MIDEVKTLSVERLVRANIRSLKPYVCARDTACDGVLLDANENPYREEDRGVELNRYPDPAQWDLRRSLADYAGLSPENVLAGSGSDEVLDWIFKVFVEPRQDRIAVAEPTYGMYRVQAGIHGAEVWSWRLDQRFDFQAERFIGEAPDDVKTVFLCSPNNPTGNLLDSEQLLLLCRRWPRVVVVDEAYIEFAGSESLASHVRELPNLIVMRTLSKAFGRAGIRLGYALAAPEMIALFQKVKAPYNLNALSMSQGAHRLGQGRPRHLQEILKERVRLSRELAEMAEVEEVLPSHANFLLFRIGGASEICRELQDRGVVVRDRSGMPGLAQCLRVSVGLPGENDLFLKRLREILKERV